MDLPLRLFVSLGEKISDPFFVIMFVLLAIIYWLFRMLDKRDSHITALKAGIDDITVRIASSNEIQKNVLELIKILIYGRRKDHEE